MSGVVSCTQTLVTPLTSLALLVMSDTLKFETGFRVRSRNLARKSWSVSISVPPPISPKRTVATEFTPTIGDKRVSKAPDS